ncbi:hypothetical protein RHMOL_Rhmol11G0245800 [Rhododendron molle]|uniref:Uncharacterized protein n=2 Tax=Rhododendron molle TaxID=49168 RepID=A0ACC0LVV2_RHOML|nr:hypothetical protein RHMOL_Rhmol11G0245800 [Rhododendron molle]KAI8532841.1 hypothetical protein RHMOL_Rhmol11G0245800 [Rhododendron molle]
MPHSEAPLIFALGHTVAVPPSSVSLNGLHPNHSVRHSSPRPPSSVPNDCYPFISVLERAKDWLPQDCRSQSLKGCVTLKIKTHHVERKQKLAILEDARKFKTPRPVWSSGIKYEFHLLLPGTPIDHVRVLWLWEQKEKRSGKEASFNFEKSAQKLPRKEDYIWIFLLK